MRRLWSINGRFVTQSITGVQRYAQWIVWALDHLLCEGHPLVRELELQLLVPPDSTAHLGLRAIRIKSVGSVNGHLWEQVVLPRHARGGLLSLCNTGPIIARKHIVCIHDLNTRSFPSSYSVRFRALYRLLQPVLGRRAAQIATVSQYSADEIARYSVCPHDRIIVIPNGHEHTKRWTARHCAATRAAAGPSTIVIVGNTAPHKNVRLILDLAGRLDRAGLRIAVVGLGDCRVFSAGAAAPAAHNIAWLGRLSDSELAALLGHCLCLAFPSFVEGFGLPPLEAMALGCPVVASDRASLPDVCGTAALYASPNDPDAWLEQFVRLRQDQELRTRMIAQGRARASMFSWIRSAELYLQAMADADGLAQRCRASTGMRHDGASGLLPGLNCPQPFPRTAVEHVGSDLDEQVRGVDLSVQGRLSNGGDENARVRVR
jgi:glycosyltransferase involved in cell wall biosynthesis